MLGRRNVIYTPKSVTTRMINYSFEKKILEVEFKSGEVYHYISVPPDVWEKYRDVVLSGESSGTYLNLNVRNNYEFYNVD